jgi:short-subunit dehydrogenase
VTAVNYRGQTTLLTGASAGIGAEFARQLAERGSDLVIVARRLDRLELLAGELHAAHGVRVTPIALDLSAPAAGTVLAEQLSRRGITVTSLINNAGFGTHNRFHDEDRGRLQAEIALNVANLVDITRVFIDGLRTSGNGILINVASMAAYQANPTMAVYGASKAFVLNFTEALWYESRGTGLKVIALSPGATETEFFDVAGASADGGTTRMKPKKVVQTALDTLDQRNPPPSVIAGTMNRLMSRGSRLVSRRRVTMTIGAMMTRNRANH